MASGGSAARRYAEAAFQLAERDNALDRWRDDLRLAADVATDPDVARLIDSPMVPPEERDAVAHLDDRPDRSGLGGLIEAVDRRLDDRDDFV